MDDVVVITGASSGIGAALAELLASRGASVALVARRRPLLQSVAERCGERGLAIVADVTSRSEVQRVVDEALARFGRIDVWVNHAGQGITRAPSQLTDDDIDDIVVGQRPRSRDARSRTRATAARPRRARRAHGA
jgi:NADP-dependent 3-hydroxy acid dehydrogenase YdfG